jgi:hypothetical protein
MHTGMMDKGFPVLKKCRSPLGELWACVVTVLKHMDSQVMNEESCLLFLCRFWDLFGGECNCCIKTRFCHLSLSFAMWVQSTCLDTTCLRWVLISFSMCLDHPRSLHPWGFSTNTCIHFFSCPVCATCHHQFYVALFDRSNGIGRGVQMVKLLRWTVSRVIHLPGNVH